MQRLLCEPKINSKMDEAVSFAAAVLLCVYGNILMLSSMYGGMLELLCMCRGKLPML